MAGQRSLRLVLPQVVSLLKDPNHSAENKLLLVSLMHQSKRVFVNSKDAQLERRYNKLTKGVVQGITGTSLSHLSWKEALFNPSSKTKLSISDITIVSRFHLNSRSSEAEFVKFDSLKLHLCSGIGITSADSRPEMTEDAKLCLDADFNIGYTGTTVDGIGVYQDIGKNKDILKSSKLTAKYVSLLADSYTEASHLLGAVPLIFSQVNQLIRNEFAGNILESACCVLTKVFHLGNSTCQVVTGSVGDCMAFAWNPSSKQVVMLASARQYDFGAQFNPLSITDKLAESQVQKSIIELPQEAVIFRMTDGAWQMLPNVQSDVHQDDSTNRSYIDTIIDTAKLSKMFSDFDERHSNPTEGDYRDMLLAEILSAVNATKVSVKKIIDDIQLLYLPKCSETLGVDVNILQFGAFIRWLLNEDMPLHDQLILMLNRLEYAVSLMNEAPVIEIFNALNKGIDFGDDVLLTVQRTGTQYESNDREEERLKCSIL